MFSHFSRYSRRGDHGVALVIVLAFVVLLTGLVVAFFSRALSARLISNSSANSVRVDVFAQNAVATTLGDLRQEIAAGSTLVSPIPAPGVYLYIPTVPATFVPCLARVTGKDTPSSLPNLVKRSASGVPFFNGSGYDATNFPPANRVATSSPVSTTAASQNGRTISAARWNKPLLLPKQNPASDTDFTPASSYAPPDWVVVARDGTNPTGWDSKLATNAANPAVGRYAYNIYDEGGILDMNAAGYPDVKGTAAPQLNDPAYKSSLAFADLKQLPGISDLPSTGSPSRQEQIVRTLVGWRNYASTGIDLTQSPPTLGSPVSGNVNAGYTWSSGGSSGNVFNYLNLLRFTNPGFMSPANPLVVSNQSDRYFASRQQLINLVLNGIADQTNNGISERAALQTALQYLCTFTRGLNQPSYAPVSRDPSKAANPRPAILPSLQGGSTAGDAPYSSGSAQDALSPNFLTVRAQSAFLRADRVTSAAAGEPLIAKRFALQRLAWLTYKGPSAERDGVASGKPADTDTKALVSDGISVAYLQQGNRQNIQNYFGLTWNGTKWSYNVHNRNGTNGSIRLLSEVAALPTAQAREPDFFELLKATIDPAALGKASTNAPSADPAPGVGLTPLNFEYARDISVDAAIIQIAANIIDQYDVDGFVTRIGFDDGHLAPTNYEREFRGVENLPYIYRVHPAGLKARDSIPASGQDPNSPIPQLFSDNPATNSPKQTFFDTGVGVLLAIPDLWNPHDQNSLMGNPRPGTTPMDTGTFRVAAYSTTPDILAMPDPTFSSVKVGGFAHAPAQGDYKGNSFDPASAGGGGAVAPGSVTPNAPGFSRTPTPNGGLGSPMAGDNSGFYHPLIINPGNSGTLTFNVPDNTVFREPTMMAETNIAGCGLKMSISNPDITSLQNTASVNVYDPLIGGLKSVNTNPFFRTAGVAALTGRLYTGIYLGVYPLSWVGARYSGSSQSNTGWVYTDANISASAAPVDGITYALQYLDESGNWVTYDEKYINLNAFWINPVDGSFIQSRLQDAPCFAFVDPRTGRFGSPPETNIPSAYPGLPIRYRAPTAAVNWLDASNCVVVTEEPNAHSGFGLNFRGTTHVLAPPYTITDWSSYTALGWHYKNIGIDSPYPSNGVGNVFFQTGLFAQNDPYVSSGGLKFTGDVLSFGVSDAQFYTDTDGVVRRAMGAYAKSGIVGQPLATASNISGGRSTPNGQNQSRPKILNRPFQSVGEMGYVFSSNPWKNLDFSTPESGYSALLDVFCVNETNDANGMVAGRLDLNTRQTKVLTAILANSYTNEVNGTPTLVPLIDADAIATALISRTSVTPLTNVSDLVGRWNKKQIITNSTDVNTYNPVLNSKHNIDGSGSYDGFMTDLAPPAYASNAAAGPISAARETAVRALTSVGNTRIWNLMLDVIAQTGRYPQGVSSLDKFVVEGEQRCWVHLAIDRCTGQVIDSKLEVVKE